MPRKKSARRNSHVHREHSAIYLFLTAASFAVSISSLAIFFLSSPATPSGFSVASGPSYAVNLVIGPAGASLSSNSYSLQGWI